MTLTPKRVRELFDYFPTTGILSWKENTYAYLRQKDGHAGTFNGKGYRIVKVDGKWYMVHRIIWFMVNGSWPIDQLDHINRDKLNNRIENLREVDNSTNCHNQGMRLNNSSGFQGICRTDSGKWKTAIDVYGRIHLGTFVCLGHAIQAYTSAKNSILPERMVA